MALKLKSKQRIEVFRHDKHILNGIARQWRTFGLAVFAVEMVGSVGQIRVVAGIIPAQHAPVALQQCVGILAGCFAEVEFQRVAALQLDADFGDQIAGGADVRTMRDEHAQRVSKWVSHVTILWLSCTCAS